MAPKTKRAPVPASIKTEARNLDALIPYARNARTHSPEQVAQIAASLVEFGWTNPILIDGKGGVIAGHGRLMAARKVHEAGATIANWADTLTVPVIVLDHLTEAQRRAYVIADNQLAMKAGWDDSLLRIEILDLKQEGFDLSLLGFGDLDLAGLLADKSSGNTDPDETPEPPANPASVLGDVWQLGSHRIACGDCTDATVVAAVLGKVRPHLMVTDPPYGVEYDASWRARAGVNLSKAKLGKVLNDDRADWREAWALFPGEVAYVWHASLFTREVLESLESCGFQHRAMIIWAKDRFTLGRGHYHWQHEPAWYCVKKGATGHWAGDRSQTSLWNIKARDDAGHGHSTQKPVECMKRPIENNSSPGQAVYEPFSGSGTTIIAAEMTGRSCHAIELSPAYVDVAVKRWEAFTGKVATHAATGATFAETAATRQVAAAEPA